MTKELLTLEEFRQARDSYAIRRSRLPATFYWADKMRVPGRENLSDCGRSVAKFGLKVQKRKYPDMKILRKVVNSGRVGIDMLDLEKGMKELGVDCEAYLNITSDVIVRELSKSHDAWVFSHQMLAGHYSQYLNMKSGHYAIVVYYSNGKFITTDPGLITPRWGQISPYVFDRINFDNKIIDPSLVVFGWAMRIGVANSIFRSD